MSSESSFASDSTIKTALFVPATTKSRSESSLIFGFKEKSFPSYPTLHPAIGPMKGIPDKVRALEAAIIAIMSGLVSPSWERTVRITWVSFLNPSGKRGLIGLSISLDVKVSNSVGLPSRLKNPPGIFPAA